MLLKYLETVYHFGSCYGNFLGGSKPCFFRTYHSPLSEWFPQHSRSYEVFHSVCQNQAQILASCGGWVLSSSFLLGSYFSFLVSSHKGTDTYPVEYSGETVTHPQRAFSVQWSPLHCYALQTTHFVLPYLLDLSSRGIAFKVQKSYFYSPCSTLSLILYFR